MSCFRSVLNLQISGLRNCSMASLKPWTRSSRLKKLPTLRLKPRHIQDRDTIYGKKNS